MFDLGTLTYAFRNINKLASQKFNCTVLHEYGISATLMNPDFLRNSYKTYKTVHLHKEFLRMMPILTRRAGQLGFAVPQCSYFQVNLAIKIIFH